MSHTIVKNGISTEIGVIHDHAREELPYMFADMHIDADRHVEAWQLVDGKFNVGFVECNEEVVDLDVFTIGEARAILEWEQAKLRAQGVIA